jgi:formylglycine-generating enzyme required for sulfatase activity
MVVDISAGAKPNTQRYYPAVEFLPGGLFGRDEYRTTQIVMRKIMAKNVTWTMGSTSDETWRSTSGSEDTHRVMLTNNYYIGVFEVTQTQWSLIQSKREWPSNFKNIEYRAKRPVEKVSYNEIRNNSGDDNVANPDYDWPIAPNENSFLGLLRSQTGIDFDLPSETQWEFAARAGNGDAKWGDGSRIMNVNEDRNLDRL